MNKIPDKQIIWRQSVCENNFRCPVCGVKLWDEKADAPTENLKFDSVVPGELYPARCSCRMCGNPSAAAWSAVAKEDGREKVEVRMYAVGITTDEAWEWMTQREEEFQRILTEAKVKAVHPDPQGRFHAFLYLHPKARNRAYKILKKHFKSAFVIAETAYVNVADCS